MEWCRDGNIVPRRMRRLAMSLGNLYRVLDLQSIMEVSFSINNTDASVSLI